MDETTLLYQHKMGRCDVDMILRSNLMALCCKGRLVGLDAGLSFQTASHRTGLNHLRHHKCAAANKNQVVFGCILLCRG